MGDAALKLHDEDDQQDQDMEESIWGEEALDAVKHFADKMDDIDNQRSQLNAEKAAEQLKLINMGFNNDALKAARAYKKLDDDKKDNFDLSYLFARRAMGNEMQNDLFHAAMKQQVKVHKAKKQQPE